jgi:hypothetical protein
MMKRLVILFLIVGPLLALTGCGNKEEAGDTADNSTPATKPMERTEK